METTISTIIAVFYFTYWIIYDKTPFPIHWLIALYVVLYIISIIIASIIKGSSDTIEKNTNTIADVLERYDKRLKKIETKSNEEFF